MVIKLNISKLITRIKMNIGIYGIALPIENLDQLITDIITDITLPVFSIYQPYEEQLYVNLKDLERVEKTSTYQSYLLPASLAEKLLYIKDVKYDDRCISGIGYWGGDVPYLSGVLTEQSMISNAAKNLTNLTLPKLNFQYEPPRKLTLYHNYASLKVIIMMACKHDPSLQSIRPTAEESFFKLAVLDVKENLYQLVKHYNEIQTAYGTIQLKIDDWQNAESERKELINQWDDTYHLDLAQMTWS